MLDADTIKAQLINLEMQKTNAQNTVMQCIGAISVLNEQLGLLDKKEAESAQEMSKGDSNDSELDCESD